MATAGNITAVLSLNATGFKQGLTTSLEAVTKFKESFTKSITPLSKDTSRLESALSILSKTLTEASSQVNTFTTNAKALRQFSTYAQSVNRLANALKILSSSEINVETATEIINNMFRAFQGVLGGTEVKVKGVISSFNQLSASENKEVTRQQQIQQALANSRNSYVSSEQALRQMAVGINETIASEEKLANVEKQVSSATNQETSSIQRQSSALKSASSSANKYSSATNRLKNALSSLKMMGTMVASMLVYNLAHNLITATRETVNAKSEMEGYFQMLHFSQKDVDHFNKALDNTVHQFQRVNKYSLGETISSIGVEFDLTTKEMEKAMTVTSMVTSEYLRAGRNANEASLAVKDVLQGQFQRLSRETGVKGSQLKEAGWSGDNQDVLGLMEALEKVGKSRNWDVFASKANSLNDMVLILQNRFGEWSAEMVNVVQPAIIGSFNSIMSTAQAFAQGLTGMWEWLNTDGWSQSAVKVGALSTALLVTSQALLMYRTNMGLVETSQLGLRKSIASLILGLKGEELAHTGVRNAIMSKILGVKAESLAENGVTGAITKKIVALKTESAQQTIAQAKENLKTMATEKNTIAEELNTLQQDLNTASTQGLITAKEEESIQEEINTASKELNAMASLQQESANTGLIASLYLLGTGEAIVTGETGALTIAWGVLNGVFALSPIGWITLAILGLATALATLCGAFDPLYGNMRRFNEMVDNTSATMQPYYDRLHKVKTQLDEAKEKHGETSSEVQKLQKKYDNAKESVEAFNKELVNASNTKETATQTYEEIGATLDEITRQNMKDLGYSKKQIDEMSHSMSILALGSDRYYTATQVANKQAKDFTDTQKEYGKVLGEAGVKGDEFNDKMSQYAQNQKNLMEHSYIANTTDDWWEGSWNRLYAGLDAFWINMDEVTAKWGLWIHDAWNDFLNWDFLDSEGKDNWNKIAQWFSNGWKWLEDILANWQTGAVDYLENNVFKPLTDLWNNFWSFEWLNLGSGDNSSKAKMIDIQGIFRNLFNIGDGLTWAWDILNTNVITPLGTAISNFFSNPLGAFSTAGIQLPQFDLIGFIKGFISNVTGGFDIGGWLSSLFNIDGIVSYFTTNLTTIVTSATTIATNVKNIFAGLKNAIYTHITGLVSKVSSGFESAKSYAVTKITAMKTSVTSVITQMTDAWSKMKDSILNSAKLIYDGVKKKFDDVGNTLKDFFGKLKDPSKWGAGEPSHQSHSPRPRIARRLFGAGGSKVGAGATNPYANPNKKVRLSELVNSVGGNKEVSLSDFMAMFSDGGFGSWSYHDQYKRSIYNEGKTWKSAPAVIKGIGSVGNGYQVERFWNGKPSFSFDEFMSVARAIFSAIPYKFYYNSEWKGNWVSALLSGATNCSDGSDALIALANVFGFSGYKQHTTTKSGLGHFYAVINGKKMDTTHFQNSGSWSPLGAGVPPRRYGRSSGAGSVGNRTVNVNIDMGNSTIYGVDDLEDKIADGVEKGLQKQFNDPYSVAI